MKTKTPTSSLETLIKRGGFGYVNENIIKLFKTEPLRGKIEVRNFGKYLTSEEIIAELKKDGCVPANATELFTWYLENKDTWFKDKPAYGAVVALGSVAAFEGGQRVPGTWWYDSWREASLGWFDDGWYDDCWFAFSRESGPLPSETLASESLRPLSLDSAIKICKDNGLVVYKPL